MQGVVIDGGRAIHVAIAGATGRTGRQLVLQGLRRGHRISALRRVVDPNADKNVRWINGGIDDIQSLRELIAGCDAVVSAIGPDSRRQDTCSTSTANLISAGARRLIVVSGMGVTLPGDSKGMMDKAVSFVVRTLSPDVFADKVRELEILQASTIDWTAVRVGTLTEGAMPKLVSSHPTTPPGFAIDTASLASFILDEAEQSRFVREAPFVAAR